MSILFEVLIVGHYGEIIDRQYHSNMAGITVKIPEGTKELLIKIYEPVE